MHATGAPIPVIVSAPCPPEILTPEMNSARWTLKALGIVNIVAGILLLAACWAVYYYAIFLGIVAIVLGSLQVKHTKTETAIFDSSLFLSANTIFRKLTFMNVVILVSGGIGTLIAAMATERHSLCGDAFCFLGRANFYFAVMGLLSSIAVTISAIVAMYLSRGLEKTLAETYGLQRPATGTLAPGATEAKYVPLVNEPTRDNRGVVFSEAPRPGGYGTTQ
jgi:hypothetical protein